MFSSYKIKKRHEVTFLSPYVLQLEAYAQSGTGLTYEEWQEHMGQCSATFFYWDPLIQLERFFFSLIRSQSSKKISSYVWAQEEVVFSYFSLHRQNYARWLYVLLRDLKALADSIFNAFCRRNLVTYKTQNLFSAMHYHQRYEQNNNEARVKCKPSYISFTT